MAEEVGLESDSTTYRAALTQLKRGAKRVLTTPYLQQTGLAYKSETRMMTLLDRVIGKTISTQPERAT
jgi:hypothetical protein